MNQDHLDLLLTQPDAGAEDSLQEHRLLCEEMGRRAFIQALGTVRAAAAERYLAPQAAWSRRLH